MDWHLLVYHRYLFSLQLEFRIIDPFLSDCRDTIAKLDNQNMKAIRGLEDRLYTLDQMIATCKKLVHEQKELAQVDQSVTSVPLFLVSGSPQVNFDIFCPFAGILGQSEAG